MNLKIIEKQHKLWLVLPIHFKKSCNATVKLKRLYQKQIFSLGLSSFMLSFKTTWIRCWHIHEFKFLTGNKQPIVKINIKYKIDDKMHKF